MSEALHILHTESSCGWGGQEIRILEESAGLQKRGHQITIACPEHSQLYQRASQWGVKAVALPIEKKSLTALRAMTLRLKQMPHVSVINTHSSTDSWLVAIALRLLGAATPIVRTRHISAPVKASMANRWLYARAANRVVTTGERLRTELVTRLGVSPDRCVSIATGIDTARFAPGDKQQTRTQLGLDADATWIGIVATLRSWKGHRFLLQALDGLTDKTLKLAIVGDGPQRDALESLTDELGLRARVHFAGNQKDVVPWLQAVDMFVLPSYANEGVSQAVMQAMAVGLPVITTDVGSMTDVVAHRDTGLLVSPQSATDLAAAIAQLVADPAGAQQMGIRAHQFAREHCGLDRMLDKMEAVFLQAAASTARR